MKASHRRRRIHPAWLLLPLALVSAAASAEPAALDRASLWVGAYYPTMDTIIGASDKSGGYIGHAALEDDLGFADHRLRPRLRLEALLGEHQGLAVDYYNVNRSRTQDLSRAITYGGTTYDANASASAKLDFDFGSVAWRWWFGSGSDVFGVGLGGAYYGVHAAVSGTATVNGQTMHAASSDSANAWAPMLELGWRHAFDDNLRVYADLSGVKRNSSRLGGHIYNAALGVEWYPWRHLGFAAEYDYTRIKLAQHRHDYNDDLDMKLNGPSLFVRVRL